MTPVLLALLHGGSALLVPVPAACRRASSPRMAADELEGWFVNAAGIAPRFMDRIMATCDDELIGSVENLMMLHEADMLEKVGFKATAAATIARALDENGATATSAATVSASSTVDPVPLEDIKQMLILDGRETWASEAVLRSRAEAFHTQTIARTSQWDSAAGVWRDHNSKVVKEADLGKA